MNENDLTAFLQHNQFVRCAENSIPDAGMSSKVDAFSAGDVLLRIIVDRGQQFIDLARTGTGVWIDVFTVASRVDAAFQVKTGSFAEAVRVLRAYWPRITAEL